MTITRDQLEDPGVSFPETLLLVPVREDNLPADFYQNHNRAVIAWHRESVGGTANVRASERGILSFMAGVEQLVGSWAAQMDPLSGESLHDILRGFGGLLNYDLGRLDPGTLSSWEMHIRARVGIDENGEWVGGA